MSDIAASNLRAHLGAGAPVELFWFAIGAPALVEIATAAGAQAIMLDAQHGNWTRDTLEAVASQVDGVAPLMVRTADLSPVSVANALDAGAIGVLGPLVETAEEAAAFVEAARFPPHGRRSGGGVKPLKADFARYYADACEQTVVGVMIETATGVENAAEIAATPGLDFIFIGTGDLALSMGEFPVPGPAYEEALIKVRDISVAAGLPCGLFTGTVTDARKRIAEGFPITVAANDIGVLAQGFGAAAPQITTRTEDAKKAG